MGAATVMLHAPTDAALAFAVEDCGYSGLPDELAHGMKTQFHLPRFPFLAIASLFSRLRGGVFFGSVQPARALAGCRESLPMLFLHGEQDDFVPFAMLDKVYAAKPGKKCRRTFANAAHAESCFKNPDAYAAEIAAFLRENGII